MKHLVFYDGQCGLCDRVVQFLLHADVLEIFAFAPLQGETALRYLGDQPTLLDVNTLVLVEGFLEADRRIFIYARAFFKICWLLGGWWTLLGWMGFLPGRPFDWVYRIVAKNRHRFFSKDTSCPAPNPMQSHRFLP